MIRTTPDLQDIFNEWYEIHGNGSSYHTQLQSFVAGHDQSLTTIRRLQAEVERLKDEIEARKRVAASESPSLSELLLRQEVERLKALLRETITSPSADLLARIDAALGEKR